MKVFVWNYVGKCSNHFHSDGGVVVFASDEVRARELANSNEGCNIKDNEKPDEVRDCSGGEEAVYIRSNAGCC